MGAAVGGDVMGMFVVVVFCFMVVSLLFLYGAMVAYRHAKSKTTVTMLSGSLQLVLGIAGYFISTIIAYNSPAQASIFIHGLMGLSLFMLALGLFLTGIGFVLFVQKNT